MHKLVRYNIYIYIKEKGKSMTMDSGFGWIYNLLNIRQPERENPLHRFFVFLSKYNNAEKDFLLFVSFATSLFPCPLCVTEQNQWKVFNCLSCVFLCLVGFQAAGPGCVHRPRTQVWAGSAAGRAGHCLPNGSGSRGQSPHACISAYKYLCVCVQPQCFVLNTWW